MARITVQHLATKIDALVATTEGHSHRIDALIATTEGHSHRIDALTTSIDAESKAVTYTFGEMRDFVIESIDQVRAEMASGFAAVDQRFDRVDQRFDRMDERFDRMDLRFDRLEERLDRVLSSRRARAPRRRR